MRAIILVLTFVFYFAPHTFASPQKFKVGDDEFSVEVPKSWQVQRDFFFPVGLVSPDNKDKSRTVIGITPADTADTNGVLESTDKDLKPYIDGREAWLSKNDGKSISYDPYQKLQWKGIESAYVLGYRYEMGGNKFHTQSFYILCNGARMIHIKTLVNSKNENAHNDDVASAIKSFQCTGKSVAQVENKR